LARVGPVPSSATPKSAELASEVDDLRAVSVQMGRPLWVWQEDTAAVALERRPDGRWRWPIVTVCVPRQSGKTTLVGVTAVHRCMRRPDSSVWYTAQTRMDAVGRFRDFVRMLRRSNLTELPPNVRKPEEYVWDYRTRMGVGQELVEFANGSTFQVFSPGEDALHGSVADLVILDEARFLSADTGALLMAAALPTMATRDGQLWIVSTGGGPESTFLAAELERSRANVDDPDSRRCHVEYGIGYDVSDFELLERVWDAHPSAGQPGGPQWDALSVAAGAMPPAQFAHEYGNRWRSAEENRVIPTSRWEAGYWQTMPAGAVYLGVDVAIDRSSAAVVACVEGVLQTLDYRPGVTWLPDRVATLVDSFGDDAGAVWIDASGPAGSVALELGVRLDIHTASTRELCGSCASLEDGCLVDPPMVGHLPDDALDASVATATHRRIGQSWAWSRVESGPVLVAASLAYGAYRTAQATPTVVPVIY